VQTLDVSIIKATNHNKVPPKEKHIKGAPGGVLLYGVHRGCVSALASD
jgi:hypothetical protein